MLDKISQEGTCIEDEGEVGRHGDIIVHCHNYKSGPQESKNEAQEDVIYTSSKPSVMS